MASLYAEHAREILGLDDTYQMSAWRSLDAMKREPGAPENRLRIEMMVCPRLEDGRLAWPMADTKTKKKCTFTSAEHDAWILGWEIRTGKCSQCHHLNPGKEWMGWDHIKGDSFRTCPRCNGTNKAPIQATA